MTWSLINQSDASNDQEVIVFTQLLEELSRFVNTVEVNVC